MPILDRSPKRGTRSPADRPARAARRARWAVSTLFFTNGAAYASVVPRYPDLKDELGLSNAALGSAVATFWLGALLVGMLGGAVVGRWGSARVAWGLTVASAANLVVISLAPSWWALAGALFVAGSIDTVADIAENATACGWSVCTSARSSTPCTGCGASARSSVAPAAPWPPGCGCRSSGTWRWRLQCAPRSR
jgi:MFS family permease